MKVAVHGPFADLKVPRQIVGTIAGALEQPQALNHAQDAKIGTL
jgi:hypothetical protein